jgi:hypothetical protein
MKSYIDGWYCASPLDLSVLNKQSNAQILSVLLEAYPSGLTAHEIAEKTGLPLKTVYSQVGELYREYYVLDDKDIKKVNTRGRPRSHVTQRDESQRHRSALYIENANSLFDIYEGKKSTPLPPGNVSYPDEFTNAWHNVVAKKEEEEIGVVLLDFLEKTLRRMAESTDDKIRNWSPQTELAFCCPHCGLNHEARDFIRATLIHLIDHLERSNKFIEFLKENDFLSQDAYDRVLAKKQSKNVTPQVLEP